ncbi:MAG: peptidylprolyl isomerase [Desulfoarculaceae bacterium]|nr:peptidylprolyl isomerase [Desulfoarculaceae bacterium]
MRFLLSRQVEPALAFHLMKFAFQVFEKEVVELTIEEYAEIYLQACHEMILHEKILLSEAACGVVIPKRVIQATLETLQAEYGGEEIFAYHLQKNNLQAHDYLAALGNDLKVEAILTRVAFQAEPVSTQEIQDYYHHHQDSFCFPEQRRTRHILLYTEDKELDLPKDTLLCRALSLHSRLQRDPQRFSQEARLYSDATSARDGGNLGLISPGDLCDVLEQALFNLAPGEISPIIQTAQGFHLLFCETIHPGHRLNRQEAYQHIHRLLTREKGVTACKTWLKSLFLHHQ